LGGFTCRNLGITAVKTELHAIKALHPGSAGEISLTVVGHVNSVGSQFTGIQFAIGDLFMVSSVC
jgi:hypothetical protein